LTTALKYNGELLSSVTETKDYHIHLLTMLGRCYLEAGSPNEALSLLQKGHEMSQHVQVNNLISQASIIQLMAKAHLALKDFEKGLELLMKGGDLLSTDEDNQNMLEQRSFLYIEIADLLKKKGLLTEALDFKIRAFEFFADIDKFALSDVLAELACSLSLWLEENNQVTEALEKLQ
jgi:tetratricopeptide (TPR) repeat protein